MKDIFDIRRFGKYLAYDVANAWRSFGTSAIVMAFMPVFIFILTFIFKMIIGGSSYRPVEVGNGLKTIECLALGAMVILSFPVKVYGNLTDRRLGSDWTLVPASAFEKTLSIVLVAGILVPVVVTAVFLGCDSLLSAVSSLNGTPIIQGTGNVHVMQVNGNDYQVAGIFYFINLMLTMVLGSMYFKKAKAAKTLVCEFMVKSALLMLAVIVITHGHTSINLDEFFENMTAEDAKRYITIAVWSFQSVIAIIVLTLLYLRVKTIKH